MSDLVWIDNNGNLLEGINYIGFYDVVTNSCELYDGTTVTCPAVDSKDINQKVVNDSPTYYWVLLLLFCFLVVLFAWYINR